MKQYVHLALLLTSLFLLSACGSKTPPPLPVPQWVYAKNGISVRFNADQPLNIHEGNSHALMVCLYQLRSTTMFEQLASNEDGLYQLLDCKDYDSSVNNVKRLFIYPEQDLKFVMDRLSGTKHLGVVAGYYILQKNRVTRTVDIPVIYSKDKRSAQPGELNLLINLGAEQIAATQKR